MVKSFRYLLQFAWVNLTALAGFAVLVVAGAWLTGVPQGAENIFQIYFSTFPIMIFITQFIFSFSFCTSNLNLALSFGARRLDFFLALQGILAVYVGVSWALQRVVSAIPAALGWDIQDRWTLMMGLLGLPFWVFPLVCLSLLVLGCLCGLVMVKSKALGTVFMLVALLVPIAATTILLTSASSGGATFSFGRQLVLWLSLFLAVALVISEWVIWRTVNRFVVR